MRKLALVAVLGLSALGFATTADAMPALQMPSATSNGIVQVEGGCGPGGHRTPYGRCAPNYRREYRACPPGFHLGRFGRCRPNF